MVFENSLPASADEITAMSHQQIQSMIRDPKLNAIQRALIKKIRRRGNKIFIFLNYFFLGRNKVAARKCRERRIQPSSDNKEKIYNDCHFEVTFL